MATDDNYKIGPFQRIVDLSFAGGFRLHYSPIYEFDQPGWGAPFQSGDPLTDINPPFGTTLTQYSSGNNHNIRHKIASDVGVGEFGAQHEDSSVLAMPGNCYWEDGSNAASWWGCGGIGNPAAPFQLPWFFQANGESADGLQTGDICQTWDSTNKTNIIILTERKNSSTNTHSSLNALKLVNVAQFFYYIDITDVSTFVWVNGTKYTVPVTSGSYGAIIMGACVKDGYIIYSECGLSNDGSGDEKIRWFKMSDSTSGTLTTIDVNNSYTAGNIGIYNLNRTYFNQACDEFITCKVDSYVTSAVRKITGSVTWSGGAPSSGSNSKTNKSSYPAYYGFNSNDNAVYYEPTVSGSYIYKVIHAELKHDFVLAYEIENSGTYYLVSYIIIQYNGWCRAYPVNATTSECDFSTYTAVSSGKIEDFTGTSGSGPYKVETAAHAGNCVITANNAFISQGNGIAGNSAPSGKSRVNYSIMIESDGTVTDLGTQLLNDTVSGNDFNARLLTIQV